MSKIPATVITTAVTTPDGRPGAIVECTCTTHKQGRTTALVPADYFGLTPMVIHQAVVNAYNPLVRASGQAPWAPEDFAS